MVYTGGMKLFSKKSFPQPYAGAYEHGSSIYKNPDGTYSYTVPRKGDRMSVNPSCHPRQRSVAVIHTYTNGIPYGEDTDNNCLYRRHLDRDIRFELLVMCLFT